MIILYDYEVEPDWYQLYQDGAYCIRRTITEETIVLASFGAVKNHKMELPARWHLV